MERVVLLQHDPSADAGLFTRIGVRPNEGTMDVRLSVWCRQPHRQRPGRAGAARQPTTTSTWRGVRYERSRADADVATADADAQVLDLGSTPTTGSGEPGRVTLDVTFAASRRPSA